MIRFTAVLYFVVFPSLIQASDPAAIEHFEAKVRPLLLDKCVSCHGDKKQQNGLRIDSGEAVLKGSANGPVIVPGDPEKSKLIQAIRHVGKIKMPEQKLLPAEIETLTSWVKSGAPFPAKVHANKDLAIPSRQHWAFQPVARTGPPRLSHQDTGLTPIDQFVQAKLDEKGYALSPIADKRTLARRAYFDLVGLPPTIEEMDLFLNDGSARAFENLIDRLLASPHYGEAQARHWLDLARYADTKGYVFTEDRNYPYAYTYRDWLIRAYNDDMPYDRFIKLQIAADRMKPTDKRDLAAMGFLTLGRRFLNNIHDIIDDRLDVTCRTFLGLTVTCARCHDHKYDPIPAKDYYSLYGVFASTVEPKDPPLIGEVERTPAYLEFEKELNKREEAVRELSSKLFAEHLEKLRKKESISSYLLAVHALKGKPNEQVQSYLRSHDLSPYVFGRWQRFLNEKAETRASVFGPLNALSLMPDEQFAAKAPELLASVLSTKDAKHPINPLVIKAFEGKKPVAYAEVAEIYAALLASHWPEPAGPARHPDTELQILGANGPIDIPAVDAEKLFNRADRNKLQELRKKIDSYKATSAFAPPRAMVLNDSPVPVNPVVFLRGNPGMRGPAVPRQFLAVLSGSERKPYSDGGRLELAEAIADQKNPLTARVMVNRIWASHFGNGLVRTPSDFGMRCDPPVQPELLDWLAIRFIEGGWSVKKIHKEIMLSRTYQQASNITADLARLDPENRLLAHMNRKRLDFEGMRDSMLVAAGHLDRTVGGKSVDLFKEPFTHRRTLYGFIDRQNLPGTFRVFDFASPDQHSPQRFTTTVPQQALFLINSPFVVEQAKGLIARKEVSSLSRPEDRVVALFRLLYGRPPTREESALAIAFVSSVDERTTAPALTRWEQLAQVLLLSNEFAFVD